MSELPTALLQTLTRTTNALRAAEVPFALAGGLGVYARGGPFSEHDVDVLIRAEDAETALKALEGWGMTRSDPNEDWLVKAYDDGLLVDLLFRPNERPVRRELLDEAERFFAASEPENLAKTRLWRGMRRIELRQIDAARADLDAALQHARSAKRGAFLEAQAWCALGEWAAAAGDRGAAVEHFGRAEAIHRT